MPFPTTKDRAKDTCKIDRRNAKGLVGCLDFGDGEVSPPNSSLLRPAVQTLLSWNETLTSLGLAGTSLSDEGGLVATSSVAIVTMDHRIATLPFFCCH